jgi:hypothetical protein
MVALPSVKECNWGLETAPSFLTIISTTFSAMTIDHTAPWNVRYWAQDYAQEAMEACISGGWWPANSLVVEHTDPASPTHWRIRMADGKGISQPGW